VEDRPPERRRQARLGLPPTAFLVAVAAVAVVVIGIVFAVYYLT
jgi:hypothetical protein